MEPARRPNEVLRLQRRLRGWSQGDVAAGLRRLASGLGEFGPGVDATMVSRWERGMRRPRPRYVRLLSALFELPAEELGFVDSGELGLLAQAHDTRRGGEDPQSAFVGKMAALLDVAALPQGFRRVGSEPWERLTRALAHPARIDPATVAHLEQVLVMLEHLEPTRFGSPALIAPVIGHLDLLTLLLRGSLPTALRARLCSIAGETAGFASWLHWNTGDVQRAAAYSRAGMLAAREADDRALGIALVASAAAQSSPRQHPARQIDELQGTMDFRPADSTPSNLVWMTAKVADAYASLGREDDCRRALDRAANLLRRVEHEGEERRPRFMVLDGTWLAGEQGASLAKVGRTDEARALLLPVLAALNSTGERDRTWLTLSLSTTYLRDREVDEAARLARQALIAAVDIGLEPVIASVRQLRDDLLAIDASPAVRELDEAVRLVDDSR